MCICRVGEAGRESRTVLRPLIAGRCGSGASPLLSGWPDLRGRADPLLLGPASQAQVPRRLLSRPTPDRLIPVEVRAVARQVHQPQPQAWRPQVLPQRLATVRRRVVPDHVQWQSVSPSVASGRSPTALLFPSSSIHSTCRSPDTPPSNSYFSPYLGHGQGPVPLQHPFQLRVSPARQRRISCRQCAPPRPTGRRIPPRRPPVWLRPP